MAIENILGAQSTALVEKFETDVRMALQRASSGLEIITRPGKLEADKQWFSVMGHVAWTKRKGRLAPKTAMQASWERRSTEADVYYCGMPIDGTDERRLAMALSPSYMEAITLAWLRERDDIIFNAITSPVTVQADSAEGVKTFVTKSLVSENTILANDHTFDPDVGTGDTPLTHFKLRKAKAKLRSWKALGAGMRQRPVVIASAAQVAHLCSTKYFNNRDFSAKVSSEQEGGPNDLMSFMGCDFIEYEPEVPVNDGTYDSVYVVVPGAIVDATPTPFSMKSRTDENLIMDPTFIDGTVEYGCVRAAERMVVEIKCAALTV